MNAARSDDHLSLIANIGTTRGKRCACGAVTSNPAWIPARDHQYQICAMHFTADPDRNHSICEAVNVCFSASVVVVPSDA